MRKLKLPKQKLEKIRNLRKNQTPQEIILWSRLRRNQLGYRFRRQYPLGKYIVDFICLDKKLIIELDGWQHREDQKEYDNERDRFLKSLGFAILRFWNNDVNNNLEGVILKIEEKIIKNPLHSPGEGARRAEGGASKKISKLSAIVKFHGNKHAPTLNPSPGRGGGSIKKLEI